MNTATCIEIVLDAGMSPVELEMLKLFCRYIRLLKANIKKN